MDNEKKDGICHGISHDDHCTCECCDCRRFRGADSIIIAEESTEAEQAAMEADAEENLAAGETTSEEGEEVIAEADGEEPFATDSAETETLDDEFVIAENSTDVESIISRGFIVSPEVVNW